MESEKRVLLGMSGGTDSSVAAMLLKDAGYRVTGVTFRFYEWNGSTEYLEEAARLAAQLGIPHIVYDAREEFHNTVIRYFIREYSSGRTPVPCTMCNNHLKWPFLKKIADRNQIAYLSTGHYVRTGRIGERYCILRGTDEEKDQSFFLWGLNQEILSRALFPLGRLNKGEVREVAARKGFARIASRKDSTGVCFCPGDYRGFLRKELGEGQIVPGRFVDEKGNFIARHQGYPFYTIGQRRGLGIHLNRPVFVKEIIPESNVVVLGDLQSLQRRDFFLENCNIVDNNALFNCDDLIVKIRYRKQANRCRVTLSGKESMYVLLDTPLTGVAPGQAAAFYHGDRLLGGGMIV